MTLFEVLREGSSFAPDRPLVIGPDRTLSYAQALARAEAFARGLSARGIRRFACVVADAAELLPLLCASTAVGAEACVFPPALDDTVVDEYLASFEQPVVVADRPLDVGRAQTLALSDLAIEQGPVTRLASGSPVLILTTGTTGKPRGVRHDWERLLGGTRTAADQQGARWLLAYNLNQFAGTQILLHVLKNGATLVAPKSNQPPDAVAALREHGVTHVSATPTFWRFVTAMLDPSTSSSLPLRQITLGGEAVPAGVLESLMSLFPNAKISQVYAGNEFGSVGSVRDHRSGLPLSVLDRGEDADVQVRIVEGELQVRSRFGMLGYYGEADVGDGWLPTGDLVRVESDRIVFMGRKTETINVGGVKVHPLPVEEIAGAVPGVSVARAYGRPSPVTGQILALDVVLGPGADQDDVERAIRAACEPLLPAARPRLIRFVDRIETRGDKIARPRAQ
jgi:acyl-CoA synthetase (AMP-forming)/AMP-acid ligase II